MEWEKAFRTPAYPRFVACWEDSVLGTGELSVSRVRRRRKRCVVAPWRMLHWFALELCVWGGIKAGFRSRH